MPIITFIEDVPNDDTPEAGPLYYKGYQCDVSENFAQQMIRKGAAVLGPVSVETAPVGASPAEKPVEAAPEDVPAPQTTKRKNRAWNPLDE